MEQMWFKKNKKNKIANWKKLQKKGEIKGKNSEGQKGATHTWKMVFSSPTTSLSPTVSVS